MNFSKNVIIIVGFRTKAHVSGICNYKQILNRNDCEIIRKRFNQINNKLGKFIDLKREQ